MYDLFNSVVVAAEWIDPADGPHYVEIHDNCGAGFDTVKDSSLETWGATERR